jgi:phosphomannomutase
LPSEKNKIMTLITSISGIRGTIGGKSGEGLTPDDIVKFTASFGNWVLSSKQNPKIIIGRDGRISGTMVTGLVSNTLIAMGIDVIDLGLSTTPTVEIAVPAENAGGGIIITASHNPKQWNALKLLNHKGEFISDEVGKEILKEAESANYEYASVDKLGSYSKNDEYIQKHIEMILALPLVDIDAIKEAKFNIVIDCVNSTGGISLPPLLKALGVEEVHELYCTPDGKFAHNPEPLPENLSLLASEVKIKKADLGIVVDPDVDRLAFVKDDGEFFGEEYTLVAIADYILQNTKGSTVSNLSSTRALRDITEKHECTYSPAAVGEVNVVKKMKEDNAVIGGEGNGGIIYPELHYGRDALAGIALFLSFLAKSGKSISQLRCGCGEIGRRARLRI